MRIVAAAVAASLLATACSRPSPQTRRAAAPNLLIITVDSLREDRLGAYGSPRARTPGIDALAARGVRFERAYAPAPLTLPSHASLMTGRYPPAHGARHNGMRIDLRSTTIADALGSLGIATAAFVSAPSLDRRFGLIKGFQTYGDRFPRDRDGRPAAERPGRVTVDEALAWLERNRGRRFFLWVHLFEPHAPHGDASDGRPADVRYDDEVAEADTQVGRLVAGLGDAIASTILVLAGDHGEAFGEHGEVGHGVFVYDTTLRVPLIIAGPEVPVRSIPDPVSLVDVAPTVITLLNMRRTFAPDGVDLTPSFKGEAVPERELYAESSAPMFDFGWSGLRTVRAGGWKYIEAPRGELYDLRNDRNETRNVLDADRQRASALAAHISRIAGPQLTPGTASGHQPDPKDRRELAARLARVTTGEVPHARREAELRAIVSQDPQNPRANLHLAHALRAAGRCPAATQHYTRAIAAQLPSADAHLGLAACQASARRFDAAADTLRQAEQIESDNPMIVADLGLVLTADGRAEDAVKPLQRALTLDPDFHRARLDLARAFARAGRRAAAAREVRELLGRLPADAPLREDAERLLAEVK